MPKPASGMSRRAISFGLNAEADTIEELVDKLPPVISDLLEPDDGKDTEIPVELVVHVSTRAQLNSDAA